MVSHKQVTTPHMSKQTLTSGITLMMKKYMTLTSSNLVINVSEVLKKIHLEMMRRKRKMLIFFFMKKLGKMKKLSLFHCQNSKKHQLLELFMSKI